MNNTKIFKKAILKSFKGSKNSGRCVVIKSPIEVNFAVEVNRISVCVDGDWFDIAINNIACDEYVQSTMKALKKRIQKSLKETRTNYIEDIVDELREIKALQMRLSSRVKSGEMKVKQIDKRFNAHSQFVVLLKSNK